MNVTDIFISVQQNAIKRYNQKLYSAKDSSLKTNPPRLFSRGSVKIFTISFVEIRLSWIVSGYINMLFECGFFFISSTYIAVSVFPILSFFLPFPKTKIEQRLSLLLLFGHYLRYNCLKF